MATEAQTASAKINSLHDCEKHSPVAAEATTAKALLPITTVETPPGDESVTKKDVVATTTAALEAQFFLCTETYRKRQKASLVLADKEFVELEKNGMQVKKPQCLQLQQSQPDELSERFLRHGLQDQPLQQPPQREHVQRHSVCVLTQQQHDTHRQTQQHEGFINKNSRGKLEEEDVKTRLNKRGWSEIAKASNALLSRCKAFLPVLREAGLQAQAALDVVSAEAATKDDGSCYSGDTSVRRSTSRGFVSSSSSTGSPDCRGSVDCETVSQFGCSSSSNCSETSASSTLNHHVTERSGGSPTERKPPFDLAVNFAESATTAANATAADATAAARRLLLDINAETLTEEEQTGVQPHIEFDLQLGVFDLKGETPSSEELKRLGIAEVQTPINLNAGEDMTACSVADPVHFYLRQRELQQRIHQQQRQQDVHCPLIEEVPARKLAVMKKTSA